MVKPALKLLLISDNPEYIQSILNIYPVDNNTPITFVTAETLSDGLNHIRNRAIDAVFLRLSRPAMHKTLNSLRRRVTGLPLIALIGAEEGAGIRAIKEGAHNYLSENTTDIVSLTRSIRYAFESCKIAEELRMTREMNLESKKSATEFEDLKKLINDYKVAAHDLNQPLTALLGSIYLMRLEKDNPEKISRNMERIEESGKRIADIVKKIQAMHNEKDNRYLGSASLMNPEQKVRSTIDTREENFKELNDLFRIVQARCNRTAL